MNHILGFEVKGLFDPVQTHAAYGVPPSQKEQVVAALKEKGATRFRFVKATYSNTIIVCFKLKTK